MKNTIKKMLDAKNARIAEIRKRAQETEDINELRSLNAELDTLNADIAELRSMYDMADAPAGAQGAQGEGEGQGEGQNAGQRLVQIATRGMAQGGASEGAASTDPRATMEYRTAFMNYALTGVMGEELRAADQVESSDLGVLLPTTVVDEIIKGVQKVYGQLYSRVKKLNIKGGVKYPIGAFSATFKRITEKTVSDRQAAGGVTSYIEFSYNIGEIRLATTLLATVLSVPVFEAELAKVIVEAYVKAMDTEILTGDSSANQCEGIITEANKGDAGRIPAENIITFSADDMKDWTKWQEKLFAVIPLSMRKERPEFVMTAHTFESNIETLQDENRQPVARNIYNPVTGDETARFKGREVVFVEPMDGGIENFNDAAEGEYFGMYWVPEKAYAINTNLQFAVKRYFDEETNQWVDKALVINDGKVLDGKYVYLLKKGTASA